MPSRARFGRPRNSREARAIRWIQRGSGAFVGADGYFRTSALGALAVAESDPNVIYAGTGEATIRIDVSHGDGVYKTTDGGKTWSHVGLADSRHIGRIQVHPQDPDLVYVAALGRAWASGCRDRPSRRVQASRGPPEGLREVDTTFSEW